MKRKENIDTPKLNEIIRLSSNILKIAFIFFSIIGVYALTLIVKEWKLFQFLFTILKVLSPLFIGIIIAWLLEPTVKYMHQKGVNRIVGTTLIYIAMLTTIYILITTLFPMIIDQTNDFLVILPSILDSVSVWGNKFLENFQGISIIDIEVVKINVVDYLNGIVRTLTTEIPALTINFISGLFSMAGIMALGLIIGFYLLFDFANIGKVSLSLLPPKVRKDIRGLIDEANSFLFGYLKGTLFISFLIFVSSAIALSIIGVESPILLGLIIGIADIIPYIGPYIGGLPAVLVAFTQGVPTGIITIIALFTIQLIEGNFIQPLVMSKTMKLHPVNVIMGILVFGYFFGIIGMIIATPLVAMIKTIGMFIEKKYHILRFVREGNKTNYNQ